jgi:hypothetical protein
MFEVSGPVTWALVNVEGLYSLRFIQKYALQFELPEVAALEYDIVLEANRFCPRALENMIQVTVRKLQAANRLFLVRLT